MSPRNFRISAAVGAAIIAPLFAQAQQASYVDQDLLLNFRSINSQSADNVTVDLGNVSTFLSGVSAAGGNVVLNESGASHSFDTQFAAGDLLDTVGSPTADLPIGFSAAAAQSNSATLWMTRVISAPSSTGSGLTPSARQSQTAQSQPAQQIFNIGQGYNNGTQLGGGNAASVGSGDPLSYYTQTVDGTGFMDYQGTETITAGAGGAIEASQNGSDPVYLAFWKVPVSVGKSGGTPDTYEGYFTFQPSGEVDFTLEGTTVVTVPKLTVSGNSSSVVISWANTGSFTLQKTTNLAVTNSWAAAGYTVVTNAGGTGSNTVTITPPTGSAFFRLHNP